MHSELVNHLTNTTIKHERNSHSTKFISLCHRYSRIDRCRGYSTSPQGRFQSSWSNPFKSEAQPLQDKFDAEFGKDKFQFVEVEDFATPGAYDDALKGVSGIIHVAGDVSFSSDHEKVIKSNVDGIVHLLSAASKVPSIKRVVITSSRIAIFNPAIGDNYKVDNNSFNEDFVKKAKEAPANDPAKPLFAYAAGKTEGEKAAWKWVKEHKPSFVLNTVLPDYVTGEIINPNSTGSTSGLINNIVTNGDLTQLRTFVTAPSYYVDVKDVARIHYAALVEPDVQNERLWAAATPFSLNQVLGVVREKFPNNTKIPNDLEGFGDVTKIQVDNSRSTELLKRQRRNGWVSLKESLLEQVNQL